jgi:YfiH family protein
MTAAIPALPAGWRWETRNGLTLLVAVPLAATGVVHAFTTRIGGASRPPFDSLNLSRGVGDAPAAVAANRARLLDALGRAPADHVEAAQAHGAGVAPAGAADRGGTIEGADGLVAGDARLVLAVHCADCVPLLLADVRRGAVAAVHAGWRGTAAGVAGAAVRALREEHGSDPGDLIAAIGPAIGPCCYEVDAPVYERFAPWPWRDRVFAPSRPGHWRLDLWAANRLQLEAAGVPAGAVYAVGLCTADHRALFYSHRRDGRTGHMAAVIAARAP